MMPFVSLLFVLFFVAFALPGCVQQEENSLVTAYRQRVFVASEASELFFKTEQGEELKLTLAVEEAKKAFYDKSSNLMRLSVPVVMTVERIGRSDGELQGVIPIFFVIRQDKELQKPWLEEMSFTLSKTKNSGQFERLFSFSFENVIQKEDLLLHNVIVGFAWTDEP